MSSVPDPDRPAVDFLTPGGMDGIDKLPIIWPGSPKVNPNHGPAPDV
jgi:hypothetical protein